MASDVRDVAPKRKHQIYTTKCGEGGWFAEVCSTTTDEVLYATRIHPSERDSLIDAMYWAENDALCSSAPLPQGAQP